MRRLGIVSLIAVVIGVVTSRAITLGQRPGKPPLLAMQLPGPSTVDSPKVEILLPSQDSGPAAPTAVQDAPPPMENAKVEWIGGDDPMTAVDAFLGRNRKEADDSIKALTRETEMLRARLQKVEAALARWEAVAGALNQGADPPAIVPAPAPGGRIRWRQPDPQPPSDALDPFENKRPEPGSTPPPSPVDLPLAPPDPIPIPTVPEPALPPTFPEPEPQPIPLPIPR